MPRIIKSFVDRVAIPEKSTCHWDDQLNGFGIRVLPSGVKSYVVKYRAGAGGRRARQRWVTIGRHGKITAQQAREQAIQILADNGRGEDRQQLIAQARSEPTLQELWEQFSTRHLSQKATRTVEAYECIWRLHVSPRLASWQISAIKRADIAELHFAMRDSPYQANHMLAVLSSMFQTGMVWGMVPEGHNPVKGIKRYPEEKKDRYLGKIELERLSVELQKHERSNSSSVYAVAAIRLLLLTGARKNEILKAKWTHLDLDRKVLHLPNSKTGKRDIYLSVPAIQVLERLRQLPTSQDQPFIIRGRQHGTSLVGLQKIWERIRQAAAIEDVRIHDLRHTAASIAAGAGMSLPVIGRLLGHTQPQTTNRYAHIGDDPAHVAAQAVGDAVAEAMGLSVHEAGEHNDDEKK